MTEKAPRFDFKPMTNDTPAAATPGSGDKWLRNCGIGCVGVIAFVAIVAFIGSLSGDDEPDAPTSYEAIRYCEDRVETMLKAPATAEFDSTSTSSNPFTVTGTVDSENSFGAMLRSSFQCTVTITGDSFTTRVDFLE